MPPKQFAPGYGSEQLWSAASGDQSSAQHTLVVPSDVEVDHFEQQLQRQPAVTLTGQSSHREPTAQEAPRLVKSKSKSQLTHMANATASARFFVKQNFIKQMQKNRKSKVRSSLN